MDILVKCRSEASGIIAVYVGIPLCWFIVTILTNMSDYNHNFNVYAYFTNLSLIGFIVFVISTWYLVHYLLKKEGRRVFSLSKKYALDFEEGTDYYIETKENKRYNICKNMYDFLKGDETIEITVKGNEILKLLKIVEEKN